MVYTEINMEGSTEIAGVITNSPKEPEQSSDVIVKNESSGSENSPKAKQRRKRRSDGDNQFIAAIKRRCLNDANGAPILQKRTSVAILNELRTNLEYKLVSQEGPVHMPTFTISVEVDGEIYTGKGRSKKLAKKDAADSALRNIIQFKDGSTVYQNNSGIEDFTSDDFPQPQIEQNEGRNLMFTPTNIEKGPVMLLNEMFNNVKFEDSGETGTPFAKFKMFVYVNEQKFEGTGPSKKLAKASAARSALLSLSNLSFSSGIFPTNNVINNFPQELQRQAMSQTIADKIGKLVMETFSQLMLNDPNHARHKVLAGIVLTRGNEMEDCSLVSISTGTKCVSGSHISTRGLVLNDCHAEIVSRRCLIDYLYTQLELHLTENGGNDSIFVRDTQSNKFRLKDGIRFHLYINTAPCGDARIFSPHEESSIGMDKHPNRHSRGQLRTKIESGEGTIPVKNSSGIQTWDGVIQGERLLTMSCSDKLCRWNVTGLQGALLAGVIEPVYLYSIVLGSLLHPVHMNRAICGRIEKNLLGLPYPYRLNQPCLALLTSSENRNPIKAPTFSVNWTIGSQNVEIVNSLNGKTIAGTTSRLSKASFYNRFVKLMQKLEPEKKIPMFYSDAKAMDSNYRAAKDMLHKAFVNSGLGNWLGKPIEQDQFELE